MRNALRSECPQSGRTEFVSFLNPPDARARIKLLLAGTPKVKLIVCLFVFCFSGAEMATIYLCICTWSEAKLTSGRRLMGDCARCRPSAPVATATIRFVITVPRQLWSWHFTPNRVETAVHQSTCRPRLQRLKRPVTRRRLMSS